MMYIQRLLITSFFTIYNLTENKYIYKLLIEIYSMLEKIYLIC